MRSIAIVTLCILYPILMYSQNLEVEGEAKIIGTMPEFKVIGPSGEFRIAPWFAPANGTILLGYLDGKSTGAPQFRFDADAHSNWIDIGMNNSGEFVIEQNDVDKFTLDVNGNINVTGKISGVTDPVSAQDAATKNYIDQMSEMLLEAGVNGIVKDIDDNVYKTIKVGTQVWMAENLKTTRYNNGTVIPEVSDATAWSNLSTPGYTWYDNDSTMNAKFNGALYNFYTVADTNSMNVCPVGWHIPTDGDWTILTDYLENNGYGYGGSGADIGKSMAAPFRWNSHSTAGNVGNFTGSNNSSGFAGLPSGFRSNSGSFVNIGLYGFWWSSTEDLPTNAWDRSLNYSDGIVSRVNNNKRFGFSVRCLRD